MNDHQHELAKKQENDIFYAKALSKRNRAKEIFENATVWKAMLTVIVPGLISQLVLGSYTFIDSLLSVNLVDDGDKVRITMQALGTIGGIVNAFVIFFVLGVSVRYSYYLGERRYDRCKEVVSTGLALSLACAAVFSMGSYFLVIPIFEILRLNDPAIQTLGKDFSILLMPFYIFLTLNYFFTYILRSDGYQMQSALTSILPAIFNIILDWVLMGPVKMGIGGAALATSLSWIFGTILGILFFLKNRPNSAFRIALKSIHWKWVIISPIFLLGLSSLGRNLGINLSFSLLNFLTARTPLPDSDIIVQEAPARYSELIGHSLSSIKENFPESYSEAAAGTQNYWQSINSSSGPVVAFLFSPVMGIVQGSQTFLSYNYGSKATDRFMKGTKLMVLWMFLYFVIVEAGIQASGPYALKLFLVENNKEYSVGQWGYLYPNFLDNATFVLRVTFGSYPLTTVSFTAMVIYSAMNRPFQALLFSSLRNFLVYIPTMVVYWGITQATGSSTPLWFSMPTTEVISSLIAIPPLVILIRNIKNHGLRYRKKPQSRFNLDD